MNPREIELVDVESARITEDGSRVSLWMRTARDGTWAVEIPLGELLSRGVLIAPERPRPRLVSVLQ
jgi:hypothetical protein